MTTIPWILIIIAVLIVAAAIVAIPVLKIKSEEFERTGKRPQGYYKEQGIAIGIPIGLPIGLALGNIALGIPIGLAVGIALGTAWEKKHEQELRPLTEREKTLKRKMMITTFILLTFGLIAGVTVFFTNKNISNSTVSSFTECIEAGNPAMESYPRQCRHNEMTYTEVITDQ